MGKISTAGLIKKLSRIEGNLIQQIEEIREKKVGSKDILDPRESEIQTRIEFVNQKIRQLKQRDPNNARSIFVSHGFDSNTRELYEELKYIAQANGFRVHSGLDKGKNVENVLQWVLSKIASSRFFISLMTKDYRVRYEDDSGRGKGMPSVWIVEEKGMALALKKKVHLLVEEGVHEDFWRKTTPEKFFTPFKRNTFGVAAREAVEYFKRVK